METERVRFSQKKSLLRTLVKNSYRAIDDGAYENKEERDYLHHDSIDLRNRIIECQNIPIITEIKYASPSKGVLADPMKVTVESIAQVMQNSGATGISVLSQPFLFNGSITNVYKARRASTLPILMKDIVVSEIQLKAAKKAGADYILLIKTIFDMNLTESTLETIIERARKIGLGVILETHTTDEFKEAMVMNKKYKQQNLIGINNRNLDTLEISLDTTKNILAENPKSGNVIISESGIHKGSDIAKLLAAGADAFLVGTSLMQDTEKMADGIKEIISSLNR
ncbi:indole-3-glycerol-phosphate synthase [Candidatus Nitrosocosmicus sp. SS]|jgi:indole-3-glycerol phosphate synthase|nr:indole-3-glycerol-phosphate synthase [Candidatus Nitrosocosmicus sp. SS]KAF0867667.1 indole-3-glycerol-phosphate synthase [Candidatus Nitrosocosmicus sp. SS]